PGRSRRGPEPGPARAGGHRGRAVRVPRHAVRCHVRGPGERGARPHGPRARRVRRPGRGGAARAAAVRRPRARRAREGAALYGSRGVLRDRDRARRAARRPRRPRRGPGGRPRPRRGGAGHDVLGGARVSSRFGPAARGALPLLFEWLDFPGRKALGSLIALPAVLPPFVGVIAFLFLYGESGFVARAVQALFGLRSAPWRLQGAGAILLVHAYSMYVYFYLFTRAGLAKLDASMLEAAQALGAGPWATLRRVTLPLLRPSLAGAALLVFMTALGSFSAPYVFGGGFRVMTTQIVATKPNAELPLAGVETVALALVAVLGFALLRRTEGDDILTALGKGTAARRRPIRRAGVRTF